MNIWIPLALIASSLTAPALANQHGTTDGAIIAAKKEVAEAQAHLKQLLAAREPEQLTWEVISSARGNGCSAHKPARNGQTNMDSCDSMGAGPHAMTLEINTDEMGCSFGGMQPGHRGKAYGKAGPGHGMMGMPMGGGNDHGCECGSKMGGPRGPQRGMMFPGMGHGKAPHGMRQRMLAMLGGQPEEQCPHAAKGHGGHEGHGQAPRASMHQMMFMGGPDGPGHGGQGWREFGQGDCDHGRADQGDEGQGHHQGRWFDEDSDDAHGQWKTKIMAFANGEQHFERLTGDMSQCDFGSEPSEEAECDSWRGSDDCAQGLDGGTPREFTFEIVEGEPNWVTGTVMNVEDSFSGDIDAEIEVLLRRLEADGTEARVIRISSDDNIAPEQLQAMIEIELDDNACNASEDEGSEIDALIREIECSINAEQPVLEDAEVQVHVIDESSSRIEELEGEVAELRELVESLVKELNQH